MRRLVGRDAELGRVRSILESAFGESVARILRIAGESGVGKSALAECICETAGSQGWLCALIPAHRIQANLPLVLARRTVGAILAALGDEAARYTSGIEAELEGAANDAKRDHASIERGLFHLLDAVLLDRPVLLVIDDMQWCDPESRGLLHRLGQTFADRRFVFSTIERTDELTETIDPQDDVLLLDHLDLASTRQLARELLPGASEHIVTSIAERVRGRAIDLVTIANEVTDPRAITEDDIAATLRMTIAKAVALLNPPLREFLQICVLIGEPIEYPILRALWAEEALLTYVQAASGRYLLQRPDGLHFVHSTVAQSIRETIPIEIPYRKRIMKALRDLPSLTTAQLEQLVEQAAGCGDQALEREYLLRLVGEAQKVRALPLVARALARIIVLTPFSETQSLELYLRLSMTYLALNRELDCIAVSSEALERASLAGVRKGLGQLVASLLFALWHSGDRNDFESTYERYVEHLTDPIDRAQLLSVRIYADYADNNAASLQKDRAAFDSLGVASPILEARIATFEGMQQARGGAYDDAERWLNHARSINVMPAVRTMIETSAAIAAFHQFGAGHERVKRLSEMLPKRDVLRLNIAAIDLLSSGAPGDAIEVAQEALVFENGRFARRVLLGIAGSAAILSDVDPPAQLRVLLDFEADLALRGSTANALAPIAAVAAYLRADVDPAAASKLLDRAFEITRRFIEPQIFWLPIVLSLAAVRIKRYDALQLVLNDGIATDRSPWAQFQGRLAKYAAEVALGAPARETELRELRQSAALLGAPFFMEALQHVNPAIAKASPASATNSVKLTRRECEVVEMIAEGRSNREIAATLVLSERTVEGHIANIFGKLDVGSRSQVAAWHVRNVMAAPR